KRARSHLSPRKTCVHCNKRQISQGKSPAGQYARKARMCRSCYEQWGAPTELEAEGRGSCRICQRPVAKGHDTNSRKARKAGLCSACWREER
ncbi:MAG: hypothetical protein ACYTAN_13340, partial [Planctomycetota bacterium]